MIEGQTRIVISQLLGTHPKIERIRKLIPELGRSRASVVIIGEPGVGKTLIAKAIHAHSAYRDEEPEVLNASLLQDREQRIGLFGGEPPILTTTRKGILEKSTTVILKRVDALPQYLQKEVCLALAESRFRRQGAHSHRPVLCRQIFTLHVAPYVLKENGRIATETKQLLEGCFSIRVPSLHSRKRDAIQLASGFLGRWENCRPDTLIQVRNNGVRLHPRLKQFILTYHWPGNIPQLKGFLRSLIMLPYESLIKTAEYQKICEMLENVDEGRAFSLEEAMLVLEQAVIKRAIDQCGGNIRQAGRLLGLTESSIHRRK